MESEDDDAAEAMDDIVPAMGTVDDMAVAEEFAAEAEGQDPIDDITQ